MNLRQLSAELAELLAEHPEYADHAVLCEDGEFEVQGIWCGDAKRNYPEIWLVGYDGAETPGSSILRRQPKESDE